MKYLTLNYRGSFTNKEYKDPDVELTSGDKLMLEDEIIFLKENKVPIIYEDIEHGFVVIEFFNKSSEYLNIPCKNIYHLIYESSKKGFQCSYCSGNCDSWNNCTQQQIKLEDYQDYLNS